MYRQGDVLLIPVPVTKLPKPLKSVERQAGRLILALGEATGHAHAVADPEAELLEAGRERYLQIGETGATLRHEEHAPIALPAGTYRIVLQREYAPGEDRYVSD